MAAERNDDGTTIKSIVMTVTLLDALAAAGEPVRLTELAHMLGEPKAKIHRHLATLKSLGIVEQARTSERYRLGWKLYQLGQAAIEQFDLKRIAEPHMALLRDLVRQTAVLSIPIGGEALVIANMEHTGTAIKFSGVPGSIAPATTSAQGRIMLAYASRQQQRKILDQPIVKLTPYSITDRDQLEAHLALIRERKFDSAPQEVVLGISTLAAPIFDSDNKLLGAVGILGSIQFIPDPPLPEQVAAVQGCAAAISADLKSTAYHGIAEPILRDNSGN